MPDRGAVRAYVSGKATVLEAAQAAGRLARAKIDVRDDGAAAFPTASADDRAALRAMLDEEIEALCGDLRLASVTVQTQVERRARCWGLAFAVAVAVFAGGIVLLVAIGESDGLVGFGAPLGAAVIAFFMFS